MCMEHLFVDAWAPETDMVALPKKLVDSYYFLPRSRNLQIVGLAVMCWAIWKLRNKACFENKLIN